MCRVKLRLCLDLNCRSWCGSLNPSFLTFSLSPYPKVAEEEDIPKQKERTHFTVHLTEAKPVDKVKLIKEIKNYVQGVNLVQVGPLSSEPSPAWC